VTIETEEKTVVRRDRGSSLMWCSACRREVEMVTPDEATQIAAVSMRTIYRWVEFGKLHFVEERGRVLICQRSLENLKSVQTREISDL
jgi:hypothetical protein